MDSFSNREVAVAIWTAVFIAWALSHGPVRRSIPGLLKSMLAWKLVASVLALAAWIAAFVWGLSEAGLWTPSLLKDTVFWFIVSGIYLGFSYVRDEGAPPSLRRTLSEQVRLIVLLEFLINAYTFSLPVELILIPIFTLLALMQVVAENDPRHQHVAPALSKLSAVAGFAMLGLVIARIPGDLETISSASGIRQLALPVVLSAAAIPAAAMLGVITRYELVFLRLDHGDHMTRIEKWRARLRLVRHVGIRPQSIQAFLRVHALDLMEVRTMNDLDAILATSAHARTTTGRSQGSREPNVT